MKKKTIKSNKSNAGHIRIISGQYRGRKLPVQDVTGLRPTTDRVKETVFNWLMTDVRNANVLDCFAGSGGLGFEALSRYAKNVTFLELNDSAAKQLRNNLQTLKVNNAQLLIGDSLKLLENLESKFDLVFVDPPFRESFAHITCEKLEQYSLLADNALIYLEVESELSDFQVPDSWKQIKEKTAGQVSYMLYQRSVNLKNLDK
ncbi:16S rRNA (guanine(966)-N(2))-methyltransferase RsmD [Pseudoalteromonas denitrificans]|uniref:Ribosomal RNA small subunit methyltransferase D n=1 Tax=Pseudoalteromonas denitrificans DSM 6059 TaxID=1123010 RepID=A0A1I1NXQ4_9GAMM|nr:16S rRNA (guanine(966)-N(2))-methyltransferase RsmD [Pseudoalteromonas denitrificans]SFD02317.1 16S rRNA m(2)G-966 methyltransferase [Pseudoalteromonas denitrificans DSM 6059]